MRAPANGWIANLSLREGDVISANQPLFALVSNNQYWIDANFKETELRHVRKGQSAKIILDMYPDHTFQGIVDSISDGSGTAFSLLLSAKVLYEKTIGTCIFQHFQDTLGAV